MICSPKWLPTAGRLCEQCEHSCPLVCLNVCRSTHQRRGALVVQGQRSGGCTPHCRARFQTTRWPTCSRSTVPWTLCGCSLTPAMASCSLPPPRPPPLHWRASLEHTSVARCASVEAGNINRLLLSPLSLSESHSSSTSAALLAADRLRSNVVRQMDAEQCPCTTYSAAILCSAFSFCVESFKTRLNLHKRVPLHVLKPQRVLIHLVLGAGTGAEPNRPTTAGAQLQAPTRGALTASVPLQRPLRLSISCSRPRPRRISSYLRL